VCESRRRTPSAPASKRATSPAMNCGPIATARLLISSCTPLAKPRYTRIGAYPRWSSRCWRGRCPRRRFALRIVHVHPRVGGKAQAQAGAARSRRVALALALALASDEGAGVTGTAALRVETLVEATTELTRAPAPPPAATPAGVGEPHRSTLRLASPPDAARHWTPPRVVATASTTARREPAPPPRANPDRRPR
jgi:hypothetical protein